MPVPAICCDCDGGGSSCNPCTPPAADLDYTARYPTYWDAYAGTEGTLTYVYTLATDTGTLVYDAANNWWASAELTLTDARRCCGVDLGSYATPCVRWRLQCRNGILWLLYFAEPTLEALRASWAADSFAAFNAMDYNPGYNWPAHWPTAVCDPFLLSRPDVTAPFGGGVIGYLEWGATISA